MYVIAVNNSKEFLLNVRPLLYIFRRRRRRQKTWLKCVDFMSKML